MSLTRSEAILAAVVAVAIFPLLFFVQDWTGVLLLGVSMYIIFLSREARRDWRVAAVICLGLSIRHVVSIINAYYTTVIAADVDAVRFHEIAVLAANSITPDWYNEFGSLDAGANAYIGLLALTYRLFGASKFVGQELSVLAFAITILIYVKLLREIRLQYYLLPLLTLFLILPSVVIFTSITMREAFQILCFLGAICWTVRLRKRPGAFNVAMVLLMTFGLGAMHNGMVVYAVFLACLCLFWGFKFRLTRIQGKNMAMKILSPVLIIGIIIAWVNLAGDYGGATRAIMEGEGTVYLGGYRDKTSTSFDRATYGGKLDTSSFLNFVPSAAEVFSMYMFAPLPWQIGKSVDIYAAAEGLMRALLLTFAIYTWYRARGGLKSLWGFLLICYLSIELLWALGTSNWGTAIRHHIVAYPVLVIIGLPGLVRFVSRVFRKRRRRQFRRVQSPGRRLVGEAG